MIVVGNYQTNLGSILDTLKTRLELLQQMGPLEGDYHLNFVCNGRRTFNIYLAGGNVAFNCEENENLEVL